MTLIVGISSFFHDSAVAIVRDGEVVAAASEERFSRKKHDASFPTRALEACLDVAGASVSDIDFIGFYEKPLLKFDRLLETYLAYAPLGYRSFARAIPEWLHTKLHVRREIQKHLGREARKRIVFCEHHESHAASAFFPSPFKEAAVLTVDGVGEWATCSWGVGTRNHLDLKQEIHFPHSLGLLYSSFTYFCGFRVNSGEYKLMGLAPYGKPRFANLIRDHLLEINEDGSFRLRMKYFRFGHTLRMIGRRFEKLFGFKPRAPEGPLQQEYLDLAASIQLVTEEIMLRLVQYVHDQTRRSELCLAGGVALNCVCNGRILREGPFKRIWIQPASGDAGGALGVAWLIWHQLLGNSREPDNQNDKQRASLLGPQIRTAEVESLLSHGAVGSRRDDEAALDREVAGLLAKGRVVAWVQGAMEFGPRALGNRSILGDPRVIDMQSRVNQKVKFRESFRPFAPAVLQEQAHNYFDMSADLSSPYMQFTFDIRSDRRTEVDGLEPSSVMDRVQQVRSELPAITHVDYSARVQTVDAQRSPRFHQLLSAFYELTECPVLINTSFNVRGEPIVCSADDAYRCFMATEIDALVINNYLFLKEQQPASLVTAIATGSD